MNAWNRDQAELLRRLALAGGSGLADECQGAALDALIASDFLRLQGADLVVLTAAGWARARAWRNSKKAF